VDRDVEEELRQLADGVADQPVVGGVVVRHERHADQHEDDVGHGEVEQQQVHGRPHLVAGQRHADDQHVAEQTDHDDDAELGVRGQRVRTRDNPAQSRRRCCRLVGFRNDYATRDTVSPATR